MPLLQYEFDFSSSEEVLHILAKILGCLQRGRTCLIVPRKKPMDEIIKSGNMVNILIHWHIMFGDDRPVLYGTFMLQKCLFPTLPEDVAITFYVQSHKLILAVYQSSTSRGSTTKCDAYQAECTVPWLNEVLVLFTVALQLCQQLKDKVSSLCLLRCKCQLRCCLDERVCVRDQRIVLKWGVCGFILFRCVSLIMSLWNNLQNVRLFTLVLESVFSEWER